MKIAHISTTFNLASINKWSIPLAEDQHRCGWEVEFITGRNADSDLVAETRRKGFKVHQINSLRKYINPLHDFKALIDLTSYLKKGQFDLVHTHLAKAGVIGRLAAQLAGTKKIIHTVYGATFAPTMPRFKRAVYRNLEKLAAKFTDRLIFVGQELKDAYVQAGVCDLQKTAVIYYSIELSSFIEAGEISLKERQERRQKIGIGPQEIVLGNVSRIVPWKGHHFALQLIKELKREFPIKMVMVGDAVVPREHIYKQKLFQQVKDLGIENDVIFTGWQKNPSFYYSIFDIYLITSLPMEGLPGAILLAAAAQLPVVGFECYGIREILGDKARLVPSKDMSALSYVIKDEIKQLAKNSRNSLNHREQMIKLQERHSTAKMIKDYRELYFNELFV